MKSLTGRSFLFFQTLSVCVSKITALPVALILQVHGLHRDCPIARDAVKALVRHVLLKAPDKADARHVAICTAVRLAVEMQSCDQHDLVVFTLRLSRTSKVCTLPTSSSLLAWW